MYGSSFRMETRRPRALRMRPTLAAVMPLPREEVTPPVTKTYFAMGGGPPGFFECYRKGPSGVESSARSSLLGCPEKRVATARLAARHEGRVVGGETLDAEVGGVR